MSQLTHYFLQNYIELFHNFHNNLRNYFKSWVNLLNLSKFLLLFQQIMPNFIKNIIYKSNLKILKLVFWLKIHKNSIILVLVCEIVLHKISNYTRTYAFKVFKVVASLFSKEQYEYEYFKCTTLSIDSYSPFIQLHSPPEF